MGIVTTNFFRSNQLESQHQIKIALTNINGKNIFTSGNDKDYIYPRSSIKIFQAIPFVQSNAIEHFNLNNKSIALACSSHRGENYHIKELQNWMQKTKIKKKDLKCGIHNPLNVKATEKLLRLNDFASVLHNNCCGKHLAMISSCLMNDYKVSEYLTFNHPHQVKIRNIFEKFSNVKIKKKNFGIDGCSAPQYSFRIVDITRMLINLIKSYKGNFDYMHEVKTLINSVISNPKYIGGTDSLDSNIMMIAKKKIFCKGGAEGVLLFIDLEKDYVGVIKVTDGNERAIPPIVYNLFKKYKLFNTDQLREFKKKYAFDLINHAKIKVGSIRTKL